MKKVIDELMGEDAYLDEAIIDSMIVMF